MHSIMQMTRSEDGDSFPYGQLWHAGEDLDGSNRLLCSGECYDEVGQVDGEGFAKCVVKTVKRGGITCPDCLSIIRSIKAIKL